MPLDHTSILKTIETRWNLPALTARDAAAAGVGDVLTLTQPRTDDPLEGVNPDEDRPSHLQQVQAGLGGATPDPR
jgi:phospholipase C